jgi:hypothetical protein
MGSWAPLSAIVGPTSADSFIVEAEDEVADDGDGSA